MKLQIPNADLYTVATVVPSGKPPTICPSKLSVEEELLKLTKVGYTTFEIGSYKRVSGTTVNTDVCLIVEEAE